ncbi:MAG: stage V sporulation protein E [Planctomycetota bacterium]|nr:MAG: stage V sporulation protein E [Planctomycetota bacterium]
MERTANYFLCVIGCLLIIGFWAIYSSGFSLAVGINSDDMLLRHSVYLCISFFVFYFASKVPYNYYQKVSGYLMLMVIVLLVLVLIPGIGKEIYGASRWIKIGGFTFQPSELAKVISIIYLANLLSNKQDSLSYFWKGFVGSSLAVGIVISLIAAEPDLGNGILLGTTVVLMLQVSGFKWKYFSVIIFAMAAGGLAMLSRFDHIMKRLNGFMNAEELKSSSGFQSYMATTSIGSGGVYGAGLGEGQIKLFYLPFVNNDFIFSLIGEEMGLIGIGFVLLLFGFFVFFGLKIALNSKDLFGTFLAFGFVFMTGLQAFFHIGVNLGLLPTKGISLPFISYGGTSLIVMMGCMGILYNIALNGRSRTRELGAVEIPFKIASKKSHIPS